MTSSFFVTPAKAGIQLTWLPDSDVSWTPAFAGVTAKIGVK